MLGSRKRRSLLELLTMHASLRCDPDPDYDGYWLVTHLSRNRTWRLSSAAAGVLLAFSGSAGRTAESVSEKLHVRTGADSAWIAETIQRLQSAGLIVAETDAEHR